jgi:hypothetical protein
MKTLSLLFLVPLLGAFAIHAQTAPDPQPSSPPSNPAQKLQAGSGEGMVSRVSPAAPTLTIKPAEPRTRGVAVQAVKTSNPLQLINPFAPASYGTGEQNISRAPTTPRVEGLNLLVCRVR